MAWTAVGESHEVSFTELLMKLCREKKNGRKKNLFGLVDMSLNRIILLMIKIAQGGLPLNGIDVYSFDKTSEFI